MKYYKNLNIKGAVLDKYALGKYIESVAENHNIVTISKKCTFPIADMKENFKFIFQTYELLNEHLKMGISIHSAGEWILDNFYLIEETVKNIENEVSIDKYKSLNGIGDGKYEGYARIYVLASEIVGYTGAKLDSDIIKYAIDSYQLKKLLTIDELIMFPIFLKISIIQNIANACEKIYVSQIQKCKVEDICLRILEQKEDEEYSRGKFRINIKNKFDYSDLKNSFIEYMSYKLKKKGDIGNKFLEILNEQVEYTGTTVDEVIKKEHLHIATIKNNLGNSITSIKNINRINFKTLFADVNKVEEILNNDPANVFKNMTIDTKDMYFETITNISKKIKMSEIFIAKQVLILAKRYENVEKENKKEYRKCHVGYYLIDDGYYELLSKLTGKEVNKDAKKQKSIIYVRSTFYIPILISLLMIYMMKIRSYYGILVFILLIFPVSEIYVKTITYICSKVIKSKKIAKMNLDNKITEENSTFVVIPTILKNTEKIDELIRKIEVYYLANESDNIYFAILGDCCSSKKEKEEFDKEIVQYGEEKIKELNEKYNKNIFHFLYRKRRWNNSEREFLGWERKRGLLNQFNEYLAFGNNSDFIINTLENSKFDKKIKYIITLDSDTNLVLNSAFFMIGAMSHILNIPVIENKRIVAGYGIMQPRVGIGLKDSIRSIFSRVFSGNPGTNLYANAVSDFYQDCFDEGIFTGKGIYDLGAYIEVMDGEIEENTVLSHDLLEGSYLRCALLSDVILLDNYPYKFTSYLSREHRWIRGDWQLLKWIGRQKNKISLVSKYKIYDNLRRSILPIMQFLLIYLSFIYNNVTLMIIDLISIFLPYLYSVIDKIVFKKSKNLEIINAHKNFSIDFSGLKGELIKCSFSLALLPTYFYNSLSAIVVTIYRLIKKVKLLEWITSEDAEKVKDNSIEIYYKKMFINLISGITVFGFLNPFAEVLGTIWILAPFVAWYLSIDDLNKNKNLQKTWLNTEDEKFILDIGKKTWKYFYDYMTEDTNYLPPDNYQIGRRNKIVYRTSCTNIGLGALAIISAYDLKFIDINKAIDLLEKLINTIDKLERWNGHLYNWYNIKTLEPLKPRYISTVDSGNFVGYMYVLKTFIKDIDNNLIDDENTHELLTKMVKKVDNFIQEADFSVLYNKKNKLLSIGYDIEKMKLTDSYYDFLASEARQASYIAIAKKDVDEKHWYNLSRTLTTVNKYKGLISWSGTAFEYLMPNINMKSYYGSLIDESCKFMIMSQIKYANSLKVPWGISESGYSVKDLNSNYQYKAFGVPWLGLKRGLEDETVISPYSTFLALGIAKDKAISNLKVLEKENMVGEYGFFEAIDYTKFRLNDDEKNRVVKTYMAHHQGLILTSINNVINNQILNERFYMNPEIESTDILLQEKMPNSIMISRKSNEKLKKQKYINEFYDKEVVYRNSDEANGINVISSDDYTILMDTEGKGYSKYKDILINRYFKDNGYYHPNGFYIKRLKTNKIWSTMNYNDCRKYEIKFSSSKMQYTREDEGIETEYKIIPMANFPAEIRRLTLKNYGLLEEKLEVTGVIEGVFSSLNQDIAHPLFNNMFLYIDYLPEKDLFIVQRKDRNEENSRYWFGIKIYSNDRNIIGSTKFEIDKEKFIGRKNVKIPDMINNSYKLRSEIKDVSEPIIAINKQIVLESDSEINIDFVICVSENRDELIKRMQELENEERRNTEFKLFKAKAEEEIKYLELNGDSIENYQKMLSHILNMDVKKKEKLLQRVYDKEYSINDLWKNGISGDRPLFVAKINSIDNIEVIGELLKAFEFYRVKNIDIELCIINGEENSYERILKGLIEQEIKKAQIEYLLNNQIFIIDECNAEDIDLELIYAKADFYMDIKYGKLKLNIEELEKKNLVLFNKRNKANDYKLLTEENKNYSDIVNNSLKFYNGIGGFSSDGKEYVFKSDVLNEVPIPWINVLSNEEFGCITTDNFGGFTWDDNSRLNRITKWDNDLTIDESPELVYILDSDKKVYYTPFNRTENNLNYVVKYGHGYTNYMQVCNELLQNATVFVSNKLKKKNMIINLKNLSENNRNIKVYYKLEFILGEDSDKTRGNIICKYNKKEIEIKNIFNNQFDKKIKVLSTEEISNIYANQKERYHNLKVDVENKYTKSNCLIVEFNLELQGFENKQMIICLGEDIDKIENIDRELEEVKGYWNKTLSEVQINTPDERLNIFMNNWCMYQTISSRIFSKTAYCQSGGAIGYRDQLQDTLCVKYADVNIMKDYILKAAAHQFIEGDVLHWWHEKNDLGVRTKFSDDLLWLVYILIEYINYTNDFEILNMEVPYVQGDKLKDDENEKCKIYNVYGREETIFEHCIRAIEKGINLGNNNLPKIGSGDWNDGFSNIGDKGKGESIWLGFFLYDILKRFEEILKKLGKNELIERYKIVRDVLKKSLNTFAWDGQWYIRAVTDTGEIIGSSKNEECKIDSISQSWSVISEAGDNDKKFIAMDSVYKYLVDKDEKIIKLLTEAFDGKEFDPGYISKYKNGVRENGGQYTHGVIWTALAFSRLKLSDKAYECIKILNPICHGDSEISISKYKGEPYVLAGDVYSNKDMMGRAGWTWYTGAASWYYKVVIENILGIVIKENKIFFNPCIPNEWDEYSIKISYKTLKYKINVKNKNKKQNEIVTLKLDGVQQENKYIEIFGSNRDFTIDIEM